MGSVTVVKVLGQRVRWVCSSADAPGAFCLTLSRPFPAPASGAYLSPLSAVLFPFWWTSRHRHVPAVLVAFERRVGFGLLVAFALELSFLLGPLDPGLGAQFTLLALGFRRRVDGHPLLTNWHRTTTVGGTGRAQQHRRDSPSAVWSPLFVDRLLAVTLFGRTGPNRWLRTTSRRFGSAVEHVCGAISTDKCSAGSDENQWN